MYAGDYNGTDVCVCAYKGGPCMQDRLAYFFRPKNDFFSGFPLAMNSLYAFGLVNTNFLSSSMKVTFGGSLDLKLLKE